MIMLAGIFCSMCLADVVVGLSGRTGCTFTAAWLPSLFL